MKQTPSILLSIVATLRSWFSNSIGLRMVIVYGVLLFFIASMIGCATQKNAEKYYQKHPEKLAEKCAYEFPVIDSVVVIDSVHFDTLYIETEPLVIKDSFYIQGDTIIKTVTKQCPPHKEVIKTVRHDSIIIRRDRAYETVQQNQLFMEREQNTKLNNEVKDLEKKRNWWRTACLITWALILFYVLGRMKKFIPF